MTLSKIRKILCVTLVSMIALLLVSSFSNLQVHAATAVYLDPASYVFSPANGTVGTLFNVTVRCSGVDDMKTWQLRIYYNDSIVNVTRWYEPTFDSEYVFYGNTTLPVPSASTVTYNHHALGNGSAGVGVSLFPAPSAGNGFTGDGLLAIITFKITATPPEGQTYSCQLKIDKTVSTYWIQVGSSEKIAFDSYTNGNYGFIPELQAIMMIAVLMLSAVSVILAKKFLKPKLQML